MDLRVDAIMLLRTLLAGLFVNGATGSSRLSRTRLMGAAQAYSAAEKPSDLTKACIQTVVAP